MAQMGTGKYTYELVRDFCKLPGGKPHRRTLVTAARQAIFGFVSAVSACLR